MKIESAGILFVLHCWWDMEKWQKSLLQNKNRPALLKMKENMGF
jgi:hypothetical protein